jgi:hypothetical protein
MKATKIIIIAILLTAGLLVGCGDRRTDQMLSSIDTLINNHPDSALQMLDSLRSEKPHWSKNQRMRYDLLHLKAENKAFVPLTSDSIAKNLVSYYDTWGNANERMMAYYLLGCVYRDKGDSPRAIDAYQKAASQADTTANDCDYYTLSCIYAQMGGVYHQQLLISNSIMSYQKASKYAYIAKDYLHSILNMEQFASGYILSNKTDSATMILKEAQRLYKMYDYNQQALQVSTLLLHLYVQSPEKIDETKQLINEYDSKSLLFDKQNELPSLKRQYYFYKGKYFDNINQLDSAEYYYRKIYYHNMPYTMYNSMYDGLLSVYYKLHKSDSIAKYARLYCEVNDSSIAKKDQELTAQMSATYDYSLFQKEALESESKANMTRIILISFIFLVVIAAIILWNQYQKVKRQKQLELDNLKAEHIRATDEYSRNLYMMQLLDKNRQQDYALMQKDNEEFESKIAELQDENSRLEKVIKTIEQQNSISLLLENTNDFMQTKIVKDIKELELKPLSTLKEAHWMKLEEEFRCFFPNLLLDLHNTPKMTKQKTQVCFLVILRVSDSCIANWMNLKPSRISNIKSELNELLFGDVSARTLCNNLRKKYNIISSEN